MSLWLDILQHCASGDINAARRILQGDLLLLLRRPEALPHGGWRYVGPIPKTVRIFVSSLSDDNRGMLLSREEDFIDYITDLIIASVRRTMSLVDFCHQNPSLSLEEIAKQFDGWDGLKRGTEQKIDWVTKHIISMLKASITLPNPVTSDAKESDNSRIEPYGYQELALVKSWQVERSWEDFKRQQELDSTHLCLFDEDREEEGRVADEGVDYGGVSIARVVLQLEGEDHSFTLDLRMLGKKLSGELPSILENLHEGKPAFGYRPIAWHNVWWYLLSTYESIPMQLEVCEPLCEVDQTLANLLAKIYPEVVKPSRLNIFRRRTKLQDQCTARIHEALGEINNKFKTNINGEDLE